MNVKKGEQVIFKGYSEEPQDGVHLLTEGEFYDVVDIDTENNSVVVRVDNPDFNAKRKESDDNPKTMLVDIFEEEFEVPAPKGKAKAAPKAAAKAPKGKAKVEEPEEDEADPEDAEEAEDEVEEEAPAPKAKAKAAPKAAAKAPAKAAAKAPAKAAAKGKVKAPAKKVEESEDPYDDLDEEQEDQEILGLVNESDDILALAKEIIEESAATDYKLGGILFHIRKSGAYKELDKSYAEKGGFERYVIQELNTEYRKAMYLVDIYYKASKFGLDAQRISAIGWAKAAKIAAVMTEDTAEELLELAESNTVADLVDNIKTSYKDVGGVKGEKKKLKIFKFKLFEDQGVGVEEVLESVASAMGFKTLDMAFEHIVMEWATEHPVKTPTAAKGKAAPAKAPVKAAPVKGKAKA